MQMSKLYAPTLKEDPREAELASHRLLLRAGMIRRGAVGLYSYLPLAWRSINKIEDIIRDEMEAIDAQEMQVPILTDGELWHQSGRWNAYGPELMRLSDRYEHEYALGPTHEETFTDLVRNELRSYKQLPVTLYQMQDKFRDERRPRFGLMRGREFIMKDAYSFSATQESLQECYDQQKQAYANVCERVGLRALPVVADSGQIGGDTSVEFMALAESGEASLVWCDCGFAADTEAACAKISFDEYAVGDAVEIETPCEGSIASLAAFLGITEQACRKSFALIAEDGSPVLCLLPGDHELNDVKAEHAFGHYDVMDGHFVPNISVGIPVLKSLKRYASVPLDVHLMISEPLKYIADFAKAGADIITFHVESDSDPVETIKAIREAGCKPSISVKPGTPAEAIFPYLELVDMVLVMTVEPGFGGQSFMADMMPKARAIRDEITKRGLDVMVEVDGGISEKNAALCAENGIDVLVSGSTIFGASDATAMIALIRKNAEEAFRA